MPVLFILQLASSGLQQPVVRARPAAATAAVNSQKSAAIVGGGPAGLLSAVMLARRGWSKIDVYDALPAPPAANDPTWATGERSYQLGLNGRGQNSLAFFDCLDAVDPYAASAQGRLSFSKADAKQKAPTATPAAASPTTISAEVGSANGYTPSEQRLAAPGTKENPKTYVTRVLQRDRLQAALLEEVNSKYSGQVSVRHSVRCDGVDVTSGDKPSVQWCAAEAPPLDAETALDAECAVDAESASTAYDLVIGADGVRSSVRSALEALDDSTTKTVRFPNSNERRYKTLPLHPSNVPGTAADLNWGFRNASLGLGMDALPTREGEMVAVLLFRPGSKVYDLIEGLESGADAKAFLADAMPPLLPYLRDDDLERFVERPVSRLPSFQLVEGDIHRCTPGGGVVLLGDAIKAVKPYFGQGANSALEDVVVLNRCLDDCKDAPAAAAAAFTAARAEDARALVQVSRGFDYPGPLGTARFLLPLLLDIQLNKLLPALFSPPMLRGLQDERNTFTGLVQTKRRERTVLLGLLGSVGYLVRAAVLKPTGLASQTLYALSMGGVGFGATKVVKFTANGGLARLPNPREALLGAVGSVFGRLAKLFGAPLGAARTRLRAALLKLNPDLEENDGEVIGWSDIPGRGPRRKRD